MKKKLLLPLFAFILSLSASAQDTVYVQTLTFDSTSRSGLFTFPDDTVSYRKIVMQYAIRCHDLLVGNGNVGCYEWDYSCNTAIIDSSQTDSMYAESPSHVISNFSGTTFNISNNPTYTYYQYDQQQVTYDSTIWETTAPVGSGSTPLSSPFSATAPVARTQYLWTASELSTAGLATGDITGLRLDLSSLGSQLNFLRIRIKHTTKTSLDANDPDTDGFTQVYHLNTLFSATGLHAFNFDTPFNWNGSDNIIVEISYKNASAGTATQVNGDATGSDYGLVNTTPESCLEFAGAGYAQLDPTAFSGISNEITISFWAYGDASLPLNTYAFEGGDAAGQRQANAHLPWGNGQVYWDCGNDGSGYDRINATVNASDFKDRWAHWAFTKNTATGDMRVYLDGHLLFSGTGKTKPIDITQFRMGGNLGGNAGYYGKMDEFRVWSVELDSTTIQNYMYQAVTAGHPNWSSLVAYYPLNEGTGINLTDASANAATSDLLGGPVWYNLGPTETFRNFTVTQDRPNAVFVQGSYATTLTTYTVMDSVMNPQHYTVGYGLSGTDLVATDTNLYYQAGWQYIYDENGMAVDSVLAGTDSTLNITTLTHYRKNVMALELLSLVTPYGNGLDLGPNGVMWEFDVTDFSTILKGDKYLYMYHGGQFQDEVDIKFIFIKGTPPRDVHHIQAIWPYPGRVSGPASNFNNILNDELYEPRNITLPANSSMWKIRSYITGHGQEGEFIARTHWLDIDTWPHEFEWQVWKECSEIPVYPQGGTWIYDRTGWCPGEPTDLEEWDITPYATPGQTISIDYGLNSATGIGDSRYLVSHQLVTYGAPNFTLDAAVEDVKRPSKLTEYSRFNPACNEPIIILRNEGSDTLTSVKITYNVRGGTSVDYVWSGSLGFLEEEEVVLPVNSITFWQGATADVFEVSLSEPNGGQDQQPDNDVYYSEFNMWDSYTGELSLYWRTNNTANQNTWKLYDETGALVMQNSPFIGANQIYTEQLNLPEGCYTLRVDDSGDDGLSFWNNPSQGTGFFRFREDGQGVVTFEPDFGGFFQYDFYTDGSIGADEVLHPERMTVFPNPSTGRFRLQLEGYEGRKVAFQVFNSLGQLVYETGFETGGMQVYAHDFDLGAFGAGAYHLRLEDGRTVKERTLVVE